MLYRVEVTEEEEVAVETIGRVMAQERYVVDTLEDPNLLSPAYFGTQVLMLP